MNRTQFNVALFGAVAAIHGHEVYEQTGDMRYAKRSAIKMFFVALTTALALAGAIIGWVIVLADVAAEGAGAYNFGPVLFGTLFCTALFLFMGFGVRRLIREPQERAYAAAVTPPPIPGEAWDGPAVGPYGPSGELQRGR
jgi:uncharacterized membrane protein YjfL (UPF0719 family)